MLARLALAVLIAFLAVPALASVPCPDQPPPMAMMTSHHAAHGHHQGQADSAVHMCIGCIPPIASLPAPAAATRMVTPMIVVSPVTAALTGLSAHPELPPPRYPA